ncbi:MAG: Uma2 family endonuclease [Campylobacteraceae bacterium]|nr:Uma2 family endonuclease [Campylobacteraceae bacterium]
MDALKLEDMPYYTYDDYALWKGKWEIIYGTAYAMSPAPMIKHQTISNKIARQLDEIFENCQKCKTLLPVDWKIAEDTVVQPDNLVICEEETNKSYITKAPKVIFEVLSKSTAKKDEGIKFNLYEREGVAYYIIVNPIDEMAKVYELKEGDFTNKKTTFSLKECEETMEFDFSKIWE